VTLVGNTVLGVALSPTTNCPLTATPIATVTATFAAANNGRVTIALPAVANVWRDVRVQISYPTSSPYVIVCSTDNFAIRPYYLYVAATDQNWTAAVTMPPGRVLNNAAAVGGVVHQAGQPFTFTAAAYNAASTPAVTSQYAGSPTVLSGPTCALPTTNCTLGAFTGLPLPAAVLGTTSVTSTYSDVGTFNLQLQDQSFASVDSTDGSSYIIPQLSSPFGSLPITFGTVAVGRFVPASFTVVLPTPPPLPQVQPVAPTFQTFGTTDAKCSGGAPPRSFTYVGQQFGYVTVGPAVVTAVNATGGITANYNGALWKLTGAAGSVTCSPIPPTVPPYTTCSAVTGSVTQTYASVGNQSFDASQVGNPSLVPATQFGAPTFTLANGITKFPYGTPAAVIPFGVGLVATNAADVFAFLRNSNPALAPFNADITLNVTVADSTEVATAGNGVINTSNVTAGVTGALFAGAPPALSGIAFDSGNQFYYGRLRMNNASGSELLPLKVTLQTQYFSAAAGFVPNNADNCTTLAVANFGQGNYLLNMAAGLANPSFAPPNAGIFVAGQNTLILSAPGAGHNGAMDMVVNLETPPAPLSTCVAIPAAVTTGASLSYLHDVQPCSVLPPPPGVPNYTQDPTAHITFGVTNPSPKSIYLRENY
jgi:MSHA biogenesis protein MshQ